MNWFRFKSLLLFYFRAITRYNVQSPFLYDFVTNVLDITKTYYVFDKIELERNKLLCNFEKIEITDFGAGSAQIKSNSRSISKIVKNSVSKKSKCRLLFNLVLHYRLKNMIELGTSLGISSSYLASSDPNCELVTLEGDPSIIAFANSVHNNLGIRNIKIFCGRFSDTLPEALEDINKLDFAFIDGHHLEVPTLEYFELVLNKCHNNSVVIIDDIYWSKEMNQAWNVLINRPEVTLSIDLFDIGILFFRKELSKQNITYIPFQYKPWRIGLFG